MNYVEFKTEYVALFGRMMKYSPNEVGSVVYAEKMANLADAHPDFVEHFENEEST
jgi:hypothetical protein